MVATKLILTVFRHEVSSLLLLHILIITKCINQNFAESRLSPIEVLLSCRQNEEKWGEESEEKIIEAPLSLQQATVVSLIADLAQTSICLFAKEEALARQMDAESPTHIFSNYVAFTFKI